MTGTFIIALLALVISTASLTWQVVQFILGASRPRVGLMIGGMNANGAVTAPVKGFRLEQLVRQGCSTPILAVQVQNRGRLAVSVTNWSISFDNKASYTLPSWQPNDRVSLPCRLEPGAEVTFLCPLDEVDAASRLLQASSKPPKWCQASASFGSGKTVRSRTHLPIPIRTSG
ncbi:hypothetical protein [Petropleomorpha daqingensis]|uniref:Uncharacterized protein n=1 Tax=Petropleomorpha daqingensis TaxID=2026353 RepID=A0A853CJG6_9ACTN|nr:hypothetical protein [Petropleomorpha daqingensis]NYJ07039.1 hypothetical protein [Petropleomorpha daqingensis]